MNIQTLLENLHQKRQSIDLAIQEIESQLANARTKTANRTKAAAIINSIPKRKYTKRRKRTAKGFSYRGTHWTQKPENRAKLIKMVKEGAKKRNEAK